MEMTLPRLAPHDKCTGCGACYSACPKGAITMVPDGEGFFYPRVGEGCIQCTLCTHVCPALKQRELRVDPAVFAAWSEEESVRGASTSGGAFTHLAEYVLEQGGVVFGAAMDDKLAVRHTAVLSLHELPRLRGAKPVQSTIGEAYRQAQGYLMRGRKVLFSGTPCQIDGLYHFLGEHPENLITCDMLCSGVSSPGVWDKMLHSMAYIKQRRPQKVEFAAKVPGVVGHHFRVEFPDGKTFDAPFAKSPVGRGVHRRLILRPACDSCPYATTNRVGDISLGYFRGLPKEFYPEEQKKGISLLLVNSVKGAHVFDTLPLKRCKRTVEEAVACNAALRPPQTSTERRREFFEAMENAPFIKVENRYLSATERREKNSPLAAIKEKLWKKR